MIQASTYLRMCLSAVVHLAQTVDVVVEQLAVRLSRGQNREDGSGDGRWRSEHGGQTGGLRCAICTMKNIIDESLSEAKQAV